MSASSSANVHHQVVQHPVIPVVVREEVPLCFYGLPAKLRESWKPENPGRRFFNCSKSLVSEHCCEFFRWVDPPVNHHYKDLLRTHKRSVEEMANSYKVARLQKKLDKQRDLRMLEKEEAGNRIRELQVEVNSLRFKMNTLMFLLVVAIGIVAVVYFNLG